MKFELHNYFIQGERIIKKLRNDPKIEEAVNLLFETWENNGTVFTLGCGGSASTAIHFASDLAKGTITPKRKRLKALSLLSNIPLLTAWTNDSGWKSVFVEQLKNWLNKNDLLIAFSVHGGSGLGEDGHWSQNLTLALKLAKERHVRTIGFTGFNGGPIGEIVDVCLDIPIDFEPYGTPLIESCHLFLAHGLVSALKERLNEANSD